MDNPQYNWVNQMVKQRMKKRKKATKLIDIIDEMNLKEDDINNMVVGKLNRLASIMFDVGEYDDNVQYVSDIMEDLIEHPHTRITRFEIEKCNNLYKQYKEIK